MKSSLSLPLLLALGALSLSAQRLVMTGARVIDGTGAASLGVQAVVVNNGRIESIGRMIKAPAGTPVIDGTGLTLLPGFFDVHTHLLASAGNGTSADWGKNLKSYLVSGVTTVVDLSTYPEQFEPMRRLLATMPGPDVMMAARMSSPGGHGAEAGRGDFHTQLVQTPLEARAAVRRIAPYQPGVIKVFTDGWRYGTAVDMTSMNQETLTALVDEAHKFSIKVLTHTVTLAKAKVAARAKVDLIIHGIGDAPFDEEALSLMKANGTAYAETMAVYEPRTGRDVSSPLLPLVGVQAATSPSTPVSPALARRWANLANNAKAYQAAGMKLALGTDAGMPGAFHGWATLHEMELLVKAGISPLDAIAAGTSVSAKALGLDGDRGTITEGKRADLVLVEGKPDENITDVFRIKHVIRNGKPVDRDALVKAINQPGPTLMTARPAPELLDDFESERSKLDTLWINNTDGGHDHSEMLWQRVKREDGSRALSIMCRPSHKASPECTMVLPLAKGSVEPVDASAWSAVEFEARGDGSYQLEAPTRSNPRRAWKSEFTATPQWSKVKLPLGDLKRDEMLNLEFVIRRQAGDEAWLELDNIRFAK